MALARTKRLVFGVYDKLCCHHTFVLAAGLSYYFFLSLFPLLIFTAAMLAFIPIPNLFEEILNLMARFMPADAMGIVRNIVQGVMYPPRTGLLSIGILGTIWAATGGFNAMIEALNMAYDVSETRPYYRTRVLAIGMAFVIGLLVVIGLAFTILGPRFGEWVARIGWAGPVFAWVWPYIRWTIIIVTMVFSVELLYFWAPNVKQNFWHTLPGAIIGVGGWITVSYALGVYVERFANYDATYGTLGGVIALMLWFYFSATAILVGAEFNAEFLKARGTLLPVKEPLPKEEQVPTAA
jgi:membrane protein